MTLTTHGIIGAATASLFPAQYYGLAWGASFLSHFFSDALPHWDYRIASSKLTPKNKLERDFPINRETLPDLVKIGFDFWLGIILSYLLFPQASYDPWLIVGGAFFGILPDPLQFAYWKIRKEPLTTLQRMHTAIHTRHRLRNWRLGVPVQILSIGVILAFVFILHQFLVGIAA